MKPIIIKHRDGKYLNEEWRQIDKFERYDISNMGRVRMAVVGGFTEIKPVPGQNKFGCIFLYNDICIEESILYLVAKYFHPEFVEGCKICFKDGNPLNRIINNIRIKKPNKGVKCFPTSLNVDKLHRYYECEKRAMTLNNSTKFTKGVVDGGEILNILQRNDFKCFYCETKLTRENYQIDHVIPLSKDGRNLPHNLVGACNTCNLMKNSLTIKEFFTKISSIYNYQKRLGTDYIL